MVISAATPVHDRIVDRTALRFGVTPFLAVIDGASVLLASLAVTRSVEIRTLVLLALTIALNAGGGLYRSRLSVSVLDDAPELLGRGFAAACIATSLDVLVDPATASASLLAVAGGYVILVCCGRGAAYALVHVARRRRLVAHPTLVVGAGMIGGQLARLMLAHPEYGLDPIGFVDSRPLLPEAERPVPLLGGHDALASVVVEFGVSVVVVAFGGVGESDMVDLLRTCDRLNLEIFLVPRLFETTVSRGADQLWGLPLIRLKKAAFRRVSWRFKRAVDIVASAAALVALSPALALCAAAVRWETGPGVLFRQERIGLDGRPFQVLKFRSLRPASADESATLWNVAADSRMGRVGRFLRASSFDELPQLWNVLRGDMSLVGPRPERPFFVAQFTEQFPRYTARHRVPSGVTGWAQVHGLRGDTSIEERARFDNVYIEQWSLWKDVTILLRTLLAVLRRSGG